jgi:hypothetical protein
MAAGGAMEVLKVLVIEQVIVFPASVAAIVN